MPILDYVLDYVILAILSISMVVGFCRGLVREMLSLAAWSGALWAAYAYAARGAVYFEPHVSQPSLRVMAAFVVIFVVTLALAWLLGAFIRRLLGGGGVGGGERLLGLLFGAARGVIIIALMLFAAAFMDMTAQQWWQDSVLVEYFAPVAAYLKALLPPDLASHFQFSEILSLEVGG